MNLVLIGRRTAQGRELKAYSVRRETAAPILQKRLTSGARCRCIRPSTRASVGKAVIGDPQQHHWRLELAHGFMPYPMPNHQGTQPLPPPPQQQQPRPPPVLQQSGQQLQQDGGQHAVTRDRAGPRGVWRRGRARSTARNLVSASGVPEPGTVQDQSSCALLLLTRAPTPPPTKDTLQPATLSFDAVPHVGQAGGGCRTDASGCISCAYNNGDSGSAGFREYSGGALRGSQGIIGLGGESGVRLAGGPQAAQIVGNSAATTPASSRQLESQQVVLVPLWDGQRWVAPHVSGLAGTTASEPPGSSGKRKSHVPSATALVPAPTGAPGVAAGAAAAATKGQEEGEKDKSSVLGSVAAVEEAATGLRRLWLLSFPAFDNSSNAHWPVRAAEEGPGPNAVTAVAEAARNVVALSMNAAEEDEMPMRTSYVMAHVATHGGSQPDVAAVVVPGVKGLRACGASRPPCRGAVAVVPPPKPHTAAVASVGFVRALPPRNHRTAARNPSVKGNGTLALTSRASAPAPGSSSSSRSCLLPVLFPSPTRAAVTAATTVAPAVRVCASHVSIAGSGGGGGDSLRCRQTPSHENVGDQGCSACEDGEGATGDGLGCLEAAGAAGWRLMRAITGCRHWRQLHAVLHEHGDAVNVLHVTAALGKLARMQLPPPPPPPLPPPDLGERGVPPPLPPRSGRMGSTGEALEVQALLSGLETAFRRHLEAACAACGGRADPWDGGSTSGSSSSNGRGGASDQVGSDCSSSSSYAVWTVAATSMAPMSVVEPEVEVYGMTLRLRPRQLATSLAALARLRSVGWRVAGDPMLLRVAVEVSGRWELASLPTQELTTLVSSFAKLGHPGRVWLDAVCVTAAAADRRMSPRQLSTFLWALATLGHQPGEAFMDTWFRSAVRAMAHFSAYDISQALWALATLHRARSPPPVAPAVAVEPPPPPKAPPPQSHGLPQVFVSAALGRARAVLRPAGGDSGGCVPQDVCNTLWAVSQLQLRPSRTWVAAVASALLSAPDGVIARCRPADLAGLLWALARMLPDAPPPRGEMLRIVKATARLAGRCGEQDLANILWALGTLHFVPPPPVMRAFGLRLLRLSAEGAAAPQLLSTALWCCVRLRLPPRPAPLRQLLAAAARRAPEFDARSAPLLLYSLARLHHLGWLPPEACQPLQPQQPQPELIRAAWPPAATATVWRSRGQVQPREGGRMDGMATANASSAVRRPAVEVTVAAPPPLLDLSAFLEAALRGTVEAEVAVEGSRPRLALPVLMWSVARLGHRPDEAWTRAYLAHSFEVLPQLSSAEACLVVSALLRLGHLPPPLWLARMEHLMARCWVPTVEQEAEELQREVHDLSRRCAAAAPTAVAVADSSTVPARCPGGPGAAEFLSRKDSPKATVILPFHNKEWWRQRERQRRREVAARVLGQRLVGCRARLELLRSSMARLRRGLTCLRARARVWQDPPTDAGTRRKGQQPGAQ